MIIMVYVFLADDFEEIEAIEPVDIMRRAGIEVKTVSVMNGLSVRGAHGITVEADMMLSDADPAIFDMIVLPLSLIHIFSIDTALLVSASAKTAFPVLKPRNVISFETKSVIFARCV